MRADQYQQAIASTTYIKGLCKEYLVEIRRQARAIKQRCPEEVQLLAFRDLPRLKSLDQGVREVCNHGWLRPPCLATRCLLRCIEQSRGPPQKAPSGRPVQNSTEQHTHTQTQKRPLQTVLSTHLGHCWTQEKRHPWSALLGYLREPAKQHKASRPALCS